MKNNHDKELRSELRLAGASEDDVASLIKLSGNLRMLDTVSQSQISEPSQWHTVSRSFIKRLAPAMVAGVACLMIGIYSIVAAQVSQPGQSLYAVKKVSEKGAVIIDPQFKVNVMIRRVREVDYLVSNKAPSPVILGVLEQYNVATADYKIQASEGMARSTPLFKYCEQTLINAEAKATGPEREAISRVLAIM